MEARWVRHTAMAERTWTWVAEMKAQGVGLTVLAPEDQRSPCVTAIAVEDGESAPLIVDEVTDRGWVIGGGFGKLKPSTFRIGHMGDHTLDQLNDLLEVLTDVVR